MDAILNQIQDVFEGQIDFDGQRLADSISTVFLSVFSIIALVFGFIQQDIYVTLWVGLLGTLLTMLVVVPPWPLFNKHPQPWLGSNAALLSSGGIVVGGGKAR